jgi:hypothetical protein
MFWKRWKRTRTKFENLRRLGAPSDKARQWAGSSKGYWRIAGSWILKTTLTNRYFEELGFPNIVKRYEELRERARRLEMLHDIC